MAENEEKRITRALRCEIIKPLNMSWDELGFVLRSQRGVMHRLMNAAVLACLDAHRRLIGGAPQTAGYQAAKTALAEYREWARKHKDERVKLLADLELPGGTMAGISSIAYDAYQKWKKSKGNDRIPSFGKGQPIPVRAQESQVIIGERGATLECKLTGGRGPWTQVALAASTGRHHETLRNLASGANGYKQLAVKLDYDERRKKWYALIAYSYPRPPAHAACDPDRVMVLHRGAHNFLYAMSSDGKATVVARGGKLMATKSRLKARRRSMQAVKGGELGGGAKGHGVERRVERYSALEDKEARIIKTFCQQTAARARDLAVQWGCGRVVIGEYGGIDVDEDRSIRRFVPRVPLFQLKTAIGNAIEPLSLVAEEVSEAYVSQLCPRCSSAGGHNKRTETFHCLTCGFARPADWVSALHMLRRAEPSENVHDERLEAQYKLERELRRKSPANEMEQQEMAQ